ncbi:hypothetical protein [Guptibacillus sedimenti]|uniref:hypothetical protein n=1 Tax=Guptibacillus sedimenti TaxID=3025680 RepID=UPI002360B4D2|nr:hypothetical protein [Pseudalkalibacillus sedimenti]
MIVKFLASFSFLVMAVLFAGVLSKVSSVVETRFLSKLSARKQKNVLIGGTVFLELCLVMLLAKASEWSYIDSLFVASLLLIALIWLPAYFRPYQENASRTIGRFHKGLHSGGIDIHKGGSRPPFFIGTLIFCTVGLLAVFAYYLSYVT